MVAQVGRCGPCVVSPNKDFIRPKRSVQATTGGEAWIGGLRQLRLGQFKGVDETRSLRDFRRSLRSNPARAIPRPSIITSSQLPPRPGTNVWWYSSEIAKRSARVDAAAKFRRNPDGLLRSNTQKINKNKIANSVACQPLTIANQLRPQNVLNRRRLDSSRRT